MGKRTDKLEEELNRLEFFMRITNGLPKKKIEEDYAYVQKELQDRAQQKKIAATYSQTA